MQTPSFWDKSGKSIKNAQELPWNFPEQKQGVLSIIGGNSGSFSTEIRIAEHLQKSFPFIKSIKNLFPDSLKKQLPSLENLEFFESTESGSFKRSLDFRNSLSGSNFALFLGDFSKNSETALAVADVIKSSPETPILLTRDTIDLIQNEAESFISRENLTIVASMVQLQNLFRALYYPKVLLLSQPLLPVLETLHKFTLSFPVSILTFHEENIVCANSGKIVTIPISETNFSPIGLWSGELASNISVFRMINPNLPLESLLAGVLTSK
ncbi:hypothetical protein IKG02_01735 [Candidatus Saccharibacteria bacterium]|nr:hypothetical protein [Candidatus Saccharibacteria bacterium]